LRWNTSGRFTPEAATLISTSPRAGSGRTRSVSFNTSGAPNGDFNGFHGDGSRDGE
jgi:hypothetical protein